jgi:Flp pilus assembly pilin Flp
MFARIVTMTVDFLRREEGATAVEYAIVVNLVILLIVGTIAMLGLNGKRTVASACDGVSIVYHTTQRTLHNLLHPRGAAR